MKRIAAIGTVAAALILAASPAYAEGFPPVPDDAEMVVCGFTAEESAADVADLGIDPDKVVYMTDEECAAYDAALAAEDGEPAPTPELTESEEPEPPVEDGAVEPDPADSTWIEDAADVAAATVPLVAPRFGRPASL